jgi:hypothetical protein
MAHRIELARAHYPLARSGARTAANRAVGPLFSRPLPSGFYPTYRRATDPGRRKLWLRDDLDQAILPPELTAVRDLAEDL